MKGFLSGINYPQITIRKIFFIDDFFAFLHKKIIDPVKLGPILKVLHFKISLPFKAKKLDNTNMGESREQFVLMLQNNFF